MYSAAENPVFLHIIRTKMAGYMYFLNFGQGKGTVSASRFCDISDENAPAGCRNMPGGTQNVVK